jgi:fructokinase
VENILVIGDVGWDLLPDRKNLGGEAALFANYCHKLGHRVSLASSIGNDQAGELLVEELARLGLDTGSIQKDPEMATRVCSISFNPYGLPIYQLPDKSACDFITLHPNILGRALGADIFYFNAYGLRLSGTRTCVLELLVRMPNTDRVFDARGISSLRDNAQVKNCLKYSQLVYLTSSPDVANLCHLIGLPVLDAPLLGSALIERFNISICIINDPISGAYVSSNIGADEYRPQTIRKIKNLLGWHEAFLAEFISKYKEGNCLKTSYHSGVNYANQILAEQ